MLIDAAVLAGGRSSRLGYVTKASLLVNGQTLLEHTVSAALSVSRSCVVVGPDDLALRDVTVLRAREDPPFSGPAAALAAGVRELSTREASTGTGTGTGTIESEAILVLACDMPAIGTQVAVLVAALAVAPPDVDGVISVDEFGYRQPLAGLYRSRALVSAISRFTTAELNGLSMKRLIEPLALVPVAAALGATDDVDTWDDAVRLGATAAKTELTETPEMPEMPETTEGTP